MTGHPGRDLLERFMRGDLSAAETSGVLKHLVTGCEVCQETTATLWDFGQGEDSRLGAASPEVSREISKPVLDAYDEVIDRVFRRIEQKESSIAREGAHARELFEELMRHPTARQHLMVANSVRFLTPTLCEHLLEKSHEAGFQDPARAVDIARLGVAVAERLEARELASEAGDEAVNLRARASAQLGNALRISSDLEGAEKAFATAESLLGEDGRDGRGGMLDRARVFDLLASLRRDQGRYAEAFRLLDRVEATYRRLGHWHLLGRTLAQKSMVCDEIGDVDTEMLLLRRALDLLDPQEEPRMFLAARHNLILALNQTGRHREAFALLFHTRPLYLQAGDRMNLVRLRWLEGSVAMGLGRIGQAEVAFREVRESFVALGLAYDAAQASLDLAHVYILQGRTCETRRLAQEMHAIFQSLNVHRETLTAWLVFREAAEMEQAGVGLVRDVAEFLKRARNNHDLQFARSSPSA